MSHFELHLGDRLHQIRFNLYDPTIVGQMLLNSHADIDRFYKMGYREENPTAKIRLEDKRIAEALLDGRKPSSPRVQASPPPPAAAPMADPRGQDADAPSQQNPDPQKSCNDLHVLPAEILNNHVRSAGIKALPAEAKPHRLPALRQKPSQ